MEEPQGARGVREAMNKKSKLQAGNPRVVKTLGEKQERHVIEFTPKRTIVTQAEASSVISYARKVKDWPALEKAVAIKMELIRSEEGIFLYR